VADPRKRSDKRFAREQGKADAAAIQSGDTLSVEERQLVNAKMAFFQGAAKEEYTREVKPALALATRRPLEMPVTYVGKLPDAPAPEQERIRRRRERTYRAFSHYHDYQLKDAYINRLQRCLDEGLEANDYWDVEMIEQIIAERAPNAPWRGGPAGLPRQARDQGALARPGEEPPHPLAVLAESVRRPGRADGRLAGGPPDIRAGPAVGVARESSAVRRQRVHARRGGAGPRGGSRLQRATLALMADPVPARIATRTSVDT
jgi:hypothetical protein